MMPEKYVYKCRSCGILKISKSVHGSTPQVVIESDCPVCEEEKRFKRVGSL